jgi:hypothetical protein
VSKNVFLPSLLPYLATRLEDGRKRDEGPVRLKLIPTSGDAGQAEKSPFPFLVVTESEPLTRILEAKLLTDSGSVITKVFLLIQKDYYSFTQNDLWLIGNKDIDNFWQKAFEKRTGDVSKINRIISFKNQMDKNGRFLPYRPLFFCNKTHVFFHPVCPCCGQALALCTDDDLLASNGLQTYTDSLRRYLFCPSCIEKTGKSEFYVRCLDRIDPAHLKEFSDLLSGYKRIADKKNESALPCKNCRNIHECFGNDKKVNSRVVPFSFYPFYMVIVVAPTLNAVDFLSLVSGASSGELVERLRKKQEIGRARALMSFHKDTAPVAPFLFEDQRFFLEVLYLKLSFLIEFTKRFLPDIDDGKSPDLGISMDQIWINLYQRNSMLPLFWNFDIIPMDMGCNNSKMPVSTLPSFFGIHALSILWFYALLVNKQQKMEKIHQQLTEKFKVLCKSASDSVEKFSKDNNCSNFAPENIFWDPEIFHILLPDHESGEIKLPFEWQSLWEEALELGWVLFETGLSGKKGWSHEEFMNKAEVLINDIKKHLFKQEPSLVDHLTVSSEDRQISDILKRIAKKWEEKRSKRTIEFFAKEEDGKNKEKYDLLTQEDHDADKEETETVILSAEQLKEVRSDQDDFFNERQEKEEVLPETVYLHQNEKKPEAVFNQQSLQPETAHKTTNNKDKDEEDELIQTVILSETDTKRCDVTHQNVSETKTEKEVDKKTDRGEEEDVLSETVLLENGQSYADQFNSKGYEQLEKSANLNKRDHEKHKQQTHDDPFEEDDNLEKTVIIKPDKSGEK